MVGGKEQEVAFNLFDPMSYIEPKSLKERIVRTNPQKVAWGMEVADRLAGMEIAWARANNIPVTHGFGEEENMVQGAQHMYGHKRARIVDNAMNEISRQMYRNTDWINMSEDERVGLNNQNPVEKNRFALEQMFNAYGEPFIKHFERVEDAEFLDRETLAEIEKRYLKNELKEGDVNHMIDVNKTI